MKWVILTQLRSPDWTKIAITPTQLFKKKKKKNWKPFDSPFIIFITSMYSVPEG